MVLPGMAGAIVGAAASEAAGGGSAVAPTWGAVGAHTAGSLAAAYPTGITAGDLLVMHITATAADGTTAYSLSGWTAGPSALQSGMGGIYTLYKVATGSESGTATPTRTGTAPTANGAVINRFSGVNTSATPYEGATSTFNANTALTGNVMTSAPITTAANGRLLVNLYHQNIVPIVLTHGSGWSQAYEFIRTGIGPDYQMDFDYKTAVGYGGQSSEVATPASQAAILNLAFALIGI